MREIATLIYRYVWRKPRDLETLYPAYNHRFFFFFWRMRKKKSVVIGRALHGKISCQLPAKGGAGSIRSKQRRSHQHSNVSNVDLRGESGTLKGGECGTVAHCDYCSLCTRLIVYSRLLSRLISYTVRVSSHETE